MSAKQKNRRRGLVCLRLHARCDLRLTGLVRGEPSRGADAVAPLSHRRAAIRSRLVEVRHAADGRRAQDAPRRRPGRALRILGGGGARRPRRRCRPLALVRLVRDGRAREFVAHHLLSSALRSPAARHRRRAGGAGDGRGRRSGQHRTFDRSAPALHAARRSRSRAEPAARALHASRDAAGPQEDGARPMKRLRLAVAAASAALVALTVALVSPLSLTPAGREAAAMFTGDLRDFRAAPAESREAALVSLAAAAYEDRGLGTRPHWLPPVSPRGLVRALVRNLRGVPEGGSTIPQQLAKLYLREGRHASLADKVRELLLASWLV